MIFKLAGTEKKGTRKHLLWSGSDSFIASCSKWCNNPDPTTNKRLINIKKFNGNKVGNLLSYSVF